MTKPFDLLKDKLPHAAAIRATHLTEKMLAEMPLQELRQAKKMSQEQLAKTLQTKQASVSRMEKRTDMYLSTLRGYIEAMGGYLDIIARFPEGQVRISQFRKI